jgi:hypothetical protein
LTKDGLCPTASQKVRQANPASPKAGRPQRREVTFEDVRQLALTLPSVEESTSYGTPAFKVKGKMIARFHQDGESVVIPVEFVDREILMAEQPGTFYITDHYLNYPLMLVRLAAVRPDQLPDLLRQAWRRAAPKSLVAASHRLD